MKASECVGKALRTFTAFAMVSTMAVAVPSVSAGAAEVTGDYYIVSSDPSSDDEMTLAELAEKVNAGESFEGETVVLTGNANYGGEPIGSDAEHAFEGSFDGGGHTVNLSMTEETAGRTEDVGLFGYVGAGGSVADLSVEGTVNVSASTTVVKNVGSLAGYVYGSIGEDGAALSNCTSTAEVTVESTMDSDGAETELETTPDSTIEEGVTDEYRTIEYVGGLVGYCAGSIDSCAFYGDLAVTTHASPNEENSSLARSIGGVAGQAGGYVVTHNYDDASTYEPAYPLADGSSTATPGEDGVSTVSDCVNGGSVTTTVDGEAGLDRFGEATTAKLLSVGGVVGYSMADVVSCVNEEDGVVDSASGDGAGGVVGNLRGVPFTGTSGTAASDAGCYLDHEDEDGDPLEGPVISVSDCENYANVSGLHAAGGVVGSAGTYTEVCTSFNDGENVTGVRWNKPMSGGVAGQVSGDVYLCYNRAEVETYTGGGYYIAGVVGATFYYSTDGGDDVDSPVPEVYGCYNTGDLIVSGSMRQAGIVGSNEGYVHDCINTGACANDKAVADDSGTTTSTVLMLDTASELKEKSSIALLNTSLTVEQYEAGDCFVPAVEVDGEELNDGYPILTREKTEAGYDGETTIDENELAFEGTGSASYSATLNPVPTLTVTYGDEELVQNADFYALPDEDALDDETGVCRDVSDIGDTTFYATIVGMGEYTTGGEPTSASAPYTIGKTSFDTCTVYIKATTYNGVNQYPDEPTNDSDSDVRVMDAAGNVIDAGAYTMEEQGDEEFIDYEADGYAITFTANDDSNYEGELEGTFMIEKASIIGDDVTLQGFKCQGVTYYWKSGDVVNGGYQTGYLYSIVDGEEVEGMSAVYTGSTIKPTLSGKLQFTQGDGTVVNLTYGTDYRLVYGDPGDASSASTIIEDTDNANTDVTTDEVGERACVTLRAVPGDNCNFDNYQNFYFDILPASIEDCDVEVEDAVYTGSAVEPEVTASFNGASLVEGEDYELSYADNVSVGTGTVTVSGIGNFTGSVEKSFAIEQNASSGGSSSKVSIAKATVKLAKSSAVYTGKAVKVGVKSVTLAGAKLPASAYTVSYKNNKAIGTATVTVTGKGSYKGSVAKTFTIKPAATKVKKTRAASKKIAITLAKKKGGVKYQIRYRVKGSKKWKTVTAKKPSVTLKKLKKGKKYQIQARTFKKVKGTKYTSSWSKTKTAKAR